VSGCQDLFVYHPTRYDEETMRERARENNLRPWLGAGGERIGWTAPANGPDAHRVVIFHGNGGQAVDRGHYVRGFQGDRAEGAWTVYILEYPGYGSRPGDPGEEAFIAAAGAAMDQLLGSDAVSPVYVVGTSLGSGVASRVAAEYRRNVPAILLITPFTTLVDAGAANFPRFLVRGILNDRYDNEVALSRYDGRLGILVAGEDRLVPAELGRRLYAGFDGPKRLWLQPDAGHNTLDFDPSSSFWAEVTRFFLRGA
jgi:pimeloyl-ACP methyl ester carboxylesterase